MAKAVRDTFGDRAVIQRCQVHKKRNVLSHLPESEKGRVGRAVSLAYMEFDGDEARRRLDLIERELRMRYPAAAGYMEAERGFKRIKGYRELPLLQAALARLTGVPEERRMESA